MKKLLSIITLLLLLSTNISYAASISGWKITITWENQEEIDTIVTKEDIFHFLANFYDWQIPESYKYIRVGFKDVSRWSELESSLQKLIYLNLIENPKRILNKDEELAAWWFFRLCEKVLWIKIEDAETKQELLWRNANKNDIQIVADFIGQKEIHLPSKSTDRDVKTKLTIMQDVYETLMNGHYNKNNFDEWEIIDSAINGLTQWTGDKYTVYFPPYESESFQDGLSGDYEWIWAYVDMEKPGAVRIVSPIPWSPSEKAGIKGWDLVIKVDGRQIEEDNSLTEVITWIKWPAGTPVVLTVDRNGKIFDITVTRERIIINDIESEKLNTTTYYMQIKSFWEHVAADFKASLQEIKKEDNINKIIIDLRNNWGWYLTEVAEILSYFVEKGETTAVVKYAQRDKTFISRGYEDVDFSDYKIIILQNSWTASASEIMIGTLKDYYPNLELIWENTFWKWSVQVMRSYRDGSLLKYTIAKWFTWKTQTGIDGVWIAPTIQLEFDLDNYKKNGFDNQLDKAIFID